MVDIDWLQEWYLSHCNGEWEHRYGLAIDTIDNPGWSVKIDLLGTGLQGEEFLRLEIERSDEDWIHCWVDDHQFNGAGGPQNLREILCVFRDWVSRVQQDNA